MRVVVTGAAGFVGSHLTEALSERGFEVVAVDCLLADSYTAGVKQELLQHVGALRGVEAHLADLRSDDLVPLLEGADAVINEAAMPGLVKSWSDFPLYLACNVLAVQRLLEAAHAAGVGRLIQISTSSVYGQDAVGDENLATEPFSPYGVSKLAAEKLVAAFRRNYGLGTTILRYFSLYGPRQRPDMAYHLFSEALLDDRPITVYGDGLQSRSNTYVHDAVEATIAALALPGEGEILNIAGGERITVLDGIRILADEMQVTPRLEFRPARPGDQRTTAGDSSRARSLLGWAPKVGIVEGLTLQARWHRERRPS